MSPFIRLLLLALPFCAACGGGTPQPKSEPSAGATSASTSSDSTPEASGTPPASSGAAASAAPQESSAPAAATTSDTSDDLTVPKGDDPWMASHQMPASDVLRTVRPQQAQIQRCMNAGKKRDRSISGEVKIRLVATHAGKVRAWKDDGSTVADEKVTQCIGELVKKLTFPKQKSPGDAWGTYSIGF
jgi:hypothetical protein